MKALHIVFVLCFAVLLTNAAFDDCVHWTGEVKSEANCRTEKQMEALGKQVSKVSTGIDAVADLIMIGAEGEPVSPEAIGAVIVGIASLCPYTAPFAPFISLGVDLGMAIFGGNQKSEMEIMLDEISKMFDRLHERLDVIEETLADLKNDIQKLQETSPCYEVLDDLDWFDRAFRMLTEDNFAQYEEGVGQHQMISFFDDYPKYKIEERINRIIRALANTGYRRCDLMDMIHSYGHSDEYHEGDISRFTKNIADIVRTLQFSKDVTWTACILSMTRGHECPANGFTCFNDPALYSQRIEFCHQKMESYYRITSSGHNIFRMIEDRFDQYMRADFSEQGVYDSLMSVMSWGYDNDKSLQEIHDAIASGWGSVINFVLLKYSRVITAGATDRQYSENFIFLHNIPETLNKEELQYKTHYPHVFVANMPQLYTYLLWTWSENPISLEEVHFRCLRQYCRSKGYSQGLSACQGGCCPGELFCPFTPQHPAMTWACSSGCEPTNTFHCGTSGISFGSRGEIELNEGPDNPLYISDSIKRDFEAALNPQTCRPLIYDPTDINADPYSYLFDENADPLETKYEYWAYVGGAYYMDMQVLDPSNTNSQFANELTFCYHNVDGTRRCKINQGGLAIGWDENPPRWHSWSGWSSRCGDRSRLFKRTREYKPTENIIEQAEASNQFCESSFGLQSMPAPTATQSSVDNTVGVTYLVLCDGGTLVESPVSAQGFGSRFDSPDFGIPNILELRWYIEKDAIWYFQNSGSTFSVPSTVDTSSPYGSFPHTCDTAVKELGCGSVMEYHDSLPYDTSYTAVCNSQCNGYVYGCPIGAGWLTHNSDVCAAAQMVGVQIGEEFEVTIRHAEVRGTTYSACEGVNGVSSRSLTLETGYWRKNISIKRKYNAIKTDNCIHTCENNCSAINWADENRCGPSFGDKVCVENHPYCSNSDWCGDTDEHNVGRTAYDFPLHCSTASTTVIMVSDFGNGDVCRRSDGLEYCPIGCHMNGDECVFGSGKPCNRQNVCGKQNWEFEENSAPQSPISIAWLNQPGIGLAKCWSLVQNSDQCDSSEFYYDLNQNCGCRTSDLSGSNSVSSSVTIYNAVSKFECPNGFVQNGNACYLFTDDEMTWENAEIFCNSRNAHVVSVHSSAENNYVKDLTSGSKWLGVAPGQSFTSPSEFRSRVTKWIDGTLLVFDQWRSGEPNFPDEECVEQLDSDGGWNDISCGRTKKVVCKRYVAQCPNGWSFHDNACYKYDSTARSYEDSKTFCASKGAHVVSIHSEAENLHVFSIATGGDIWLGIEPGMPYASPEEFRDRVRFWGDGTPVSFTKWWGVEPNSLGEECITLWWAGQGGIGSYWNDLSCYGTIGVVCKSVLADPRDKFVRIAAKACGSLGAANIGTAAECRIAAIDAELISEDETITVQDGDSDLHAANLPLGCFYDNDRGGSLNEVIFNSVPPSGDTDWRMVDSICIEESYGVDVAAVEVSNSAACCYKMLITGTARFNGLYTMEEIPHNGQPYYRNHDGQYLFYVDPIWILSDSLTTYSHYEIGPNQCPDQILTQNSFTASCYVGSALNIQDDVGVEETPTSENDDSVVTVKSSECSNNSPDLFSIILAVCVAILALLIGILVWQNHQSKLPSIDIPSLELTERAFSDDQPARKARNDKLLTQGTVFHNRLSDLSTNEQIQISERRDFSLSDSDAVSVGSLPSDVM